ncbi:DUF697 domain-containing protein [Kitasatospora sp. NPDC048365]|uniref:DUF697 domain-containing protein n=1 Tax=Kitasatospora sp. NPDC048365 TaxID=3364050 RepID=UPI0037188031
MSNLPPTADPKQQAKAEIKKAVTTAGLVGGAAGALPVPFVDVALVAPVQIRMVRAIADAYGLPECERAAVAPMSLLLGAGTAKASRAAAEKVTDVALRQLVKVLAERATRFVPVIGSAVGATVSAAVAVAATKGLGEAWAKACEYAANNELKKLDAFLESDRGRLLITVLTGLGYWSLLDTLVREPLSQRKIDTLRAENKGLQDAVERLETEKAELNRIVERRVERSEAVARGLRKENADLRARAKRGKLVESFARGAGSATVTELGKAALQWTRDHWHEFAEWLTEN